MRFFHTFIGAFYSPDTYRQARSEEGYGLGYSFLLVVLTTLFVVIGYTCILHDAVFAAHNGKAPLFDDLTMQIADQVPIMTLQHDQLQTKEPGKHSILLRGELFGHLYQGAVITIDTSGTSTYENMDTPMLITAHEVIMRSEKETKIKSFKEVMGKNQGTLVVNHALAIDMGTRIVKLVHANLIKFYLIAGVFAWIGFIIVLYILRLFMLLALGVGGLAIGNIMNSPAKYGTCVRLAGVGYTPVAILSTALLIFCTHALAAIWLLVAGLVMLVAAFYVTRETPLAPLA